MSVLKRVALATGTGAVAAALFAAAPAGASPLPAQHDDASAVFVQTDNTAGNAVAAYDRGRDGTLALAGTYLTGGNGGQLTGSVVDHLASQGSLVLDREAGLLYAVNAGSDTVTVFAVHGATLHRLQVIGSGGTFPVSITVHGTSVYVLNARDGGSVQGFVRAGTRLVRVPAWHRALGLNTTATPEFVNTPGQVAFTPGGRQLVVTTKANGNQIDVFGVGRNGLSSQPVVTSDAGNVPFAVTFESGGVLDVAEAGPSAVARFQLHRDGSLTLLSRTTTGQAATCWIASNGSVLYAQNAGSASVTTLSVTPTGVVDEGNTAADGGTVDATVAPDGRDLYVQTGAKGIVDEYAISGTTLTQVGSVTVAGAVGGEGIAAS